MTVVDQRGEQQVGLVHRIQRPEAHAEKYPLVHDRLDDPGIAHLDQAGAQLVGIGDLGERAGLNENLTGSHRDGGDDAVRLRNR